MPVCPDDCGALIEVRNVDGFSLVSRGAGGLYGTNYSNKGGTPPGTHKAPRRPTALAVDNSTNLHMENFFMTHQVGVAFWHNVQNVSIINCSIDNRDKPVEERSEPLIRFFQAPPRRLWTNVLAFCLPAATSRLAELGATESPGTAHCNTSRGFCPRTT